MAKTIVVCGATGGLGGSVARRMLKEGWKVRGITRNKESTGAKALVEAGAELASADYDDVASLEAAFKASEVSDERALKSAKMTVTGSQRRLRRDELLRVHVGQWDRGCCEEGDSATCQHCHCG